MKRMTFAAFFAAAALLTAAGCASPSSAQSSSGTAARHADPIDSPRVQANAERSFARLDGDEDSLEAEADAMHAEALAQNKPEAEAAPAGEAPASAPAAETDTPAPAEAVPADTASPAEAEAAPAAAAETEAPDAAAEAGQSESESAAPAGDASAAAAPIPAADVQVGECVLLPARGRRASQSAVNTLCRNARYDLSCEEGRLEISTLSTGGPFHPWTFVVRGCEKEATYHMVGDLIRLVTEAPDSTQPRADGRPPICVVRPYAGRQISTTAHGLICNQARSDLQCPDGDLRIIVLQIGWGPTPWHVAVEGCGYSVRYLMKGNTLGRLQ